MRFATTGKGVAHSKARFGLLFIALIVVLPRIGFAQDKIDVQALVKETQRLSQGSGEMTLVWWVPEQFWTASLAQNASVPKEKVEEFVAVLRPYTVLVIADGQVGPFGAIKWKDEPVVRAAIALKDVRGASYGPLSQGEIGEDAKALLTMVKPLLVNMLGKTGENMWFVLFPATSKNGQPVADALQEGSLTIKLAEREFKYQLPLGSLLPRKYDPASGEVFPGNYNCEVTIATIPPNSSLAAEKWSTKAYQIL